MYHRSEADSLARMGLSIITASLWENAAKPPRIHVSTGQYVQICTPKWPLFATCFLVITKCLHTFECTIMQH